MHLLVTGGAGFIGSNFIRYILKKYPEYRITNLDKLTYAGNLDNLREVEENSNYRFIKGDICDKEVVDELVKASDVVINFAAETHVDRSIIYGGDFVKTDVYGTFVLLEASRKHGIHRLIQISTDEVYGDCGDCPSKEEDELKPQSPYAASKAGGDRLAFAYWVTYKVPVVITRCTNNYGPNQYPEKLIPLFVTNVIENKPMPVYGSGENRRDWIYVVDHCKAIDVLLHSEGIEGEVFNIGANCERSVLEIARLILEVLNKPKDLIRFVEDRPGHVRRHAVDISKIRDLLGWKPEDNFYEAMKKTINWYLENEWWWKRIKYRKDYRHYYSKQYGERRIK